MATKLTLFHGSLSSSIKSFLVGSHFGTADQALSAIGAKYYLDHVELDSPTLYEVSIAASSNLIKEYPRDWGKPGAYGCLIPLTDVSADIGITSKQRERLKASLDVIKSMPKSTTTTEKNNYASSILLTECKGKIELLKYPNTVEDEGYSYCVLNPEILTIESKTEVSWEDINIAFQKHKQRGDCKLMA